MANPNRCIITIVTVSHLHWARALGSSVRATNSDCDFLVLVLDATSRKLKESALEASGTKFFGSDEIADTRFHDACRYFNAFELVCAAKSFFLNHALFALGYRFAAYLDADIWCYNSLAPIWRALEASSLAVTPHTNSPYPIDGEMPDDREMVTHGFVNGGFLAVKATEEVRQAMEWLMDKVVHFGFFEPSIQLIADQTWMSCLPWFFQRQVVVVRHDGMNVAYWNLHERRLQRLDENLWSNRDELVFFHFSGFDPTDPTRLTKHSNRALSPDNRLVVSELLVDYCREIKRARSRDGSIGPDVPISAGTLSSRLRRYRSIYRANPPWTTTYGRARALRNLITSIVRSP